MGPKSQILMLTKPLDRFPVIRTRSVEKMRAALAQVYTKPIFELQGRVRTLDVSFNNYQLQHSGLSYVKYGAPVRLEFPDTDFLSQLFPIKGKGEVLTGGTLVSMTQDSGVVNSPYTSFTAKLSADYEHLVLRMDSTALARKLAAMIGAPISRTLRIDPMPNFARPDAQILRQHLMFLVNKLSMAAAPLPALMLAEFEQSLMVMFLRANRHNYSHLFELQPSDSAPWQVRRAEEYIEANWDQPITLEDLAAVTGVSARSLFRTFKRSRGYSPMDFVNQTRRRYKSKH
jgi:hypothetical protein